MRPEGTQGACDGPAAPSEGRGDDAVVLVEDGRVVLFDEAAQALLGLGREEVEGRPLEELWRQVHAGTLPEQDSDGHLLQIQRRDGSTALAIVAQARLPAAGVVRRILLLRDVTCERERHELHQRLTLVANATDRALLLLDGERRIVYANPAFTRMLGYSFAEVAGRMPSEVLASRNADPAAVERISRKGRALQAFRDTFHAAHKEGRDVWLEIAVNPVADSDGIVRNIVVLMDDVTKSREIEALRREAIEALATDMGLPEFADVICRRVEAMAPEVICSILLVDDEGRLRPLAAPSLPAHYSQALDGRAISASCGSCGTAAFLGQPVTVTDIAADPLWDDYRALALPLGLKACWSSPIKRRDGRVVGTFAFYFREPRGPSPQHERIVANCVHLCTIAIERQAAQAQIARLSHFDRLTGLPNGARFQEDSGELLARLTGGSVAMLFVDLDRFKGVNESFGHEAGDKLLIEAALRLQKLVHGQDTIYRLAGDEFLLVLPNTIAREAAARAEAVLAALAAPLDLLGMVFAGTASIGISLYPQNGVDGDTLLQHAQIALAEAKATRRGSYRFFSPDMNLAVQERSRMTLALRNAIAGDLLELHYQPQVLVAPESGQALYGVEALARWTDPVLGSVSPEKFIPLAEEIGQIEAIGHWSLREACRQIAAWDRAGLAIASVSVNLSALQFRNDDLPLLIDGLLREFRLRPDRLTIEITESVMMDGRTATLETVRAVRRLGVGLAMDDFGTGFSSLSRLPHLPITELKIDRSFMRDVRKDAVAAALATAVVRIGQSLGLKVVAEGVETPEQLAFLADIGCPVAQGYLFSRALPPARLAQWIHARKQAALA